MVGRSPDVAETSRSWKENFLAVAREIFKDDKRDLIYTMHENFTHQFDPNSSSIVDQREDLSLVTFVEPSFVVLTSSAHSWASPKRSEVRPADPGLRIPASSCRV
jgi:hypothetical protein